MKRREFLTLVGGAAAGWPLAARAQQPALPVVGFLAVGWSADAFVSRVAAFRKGLNESGYVEGQNVTVEYHYPEGQYDRLPALVADLVRRRVAVIVTPAAVAALAAKAVRRLNSRQGRADAESRPCRVLPSARGGRCATAPVGSRTGEIASTPLPTSNCCLLRCKNGSAFRGTAENICSL